MLRAEDYRRYAADCLALAQQAGNPQDRARLLEMAHAFNEWAIKIASQDSAPPEPDPDDK